ncbi:ester cyclase [Actinomadura atramentaria]|uniref:ester cyclase n=1 Tax=Actinomadura atramentaria TaxID=1990 RepID=UPI000365BF54|nr:ester cyclase [Actinomadura atramentaria]
MTDLDALYRRWLFDLWGGDPSAADDLLTPGFVGHWPGLDVHGPAGAAEQIRRSRALFTGVRLTLDVGPLVSGDLVAARWTFRGDYAGGLPDAAAPPGTPVAFAGHDILRASGDRFAEYWVVSDGLGLMTALGAV